MVPEAVFGAALAAIRFWQERRIDWWLNGGIGLIVIIYAFAWWSGGTARWAAIARHGLGIPVA